MKANKDQIIYYMNEWDGALVGYVREFVAHSWGKKVGRVRDTKTGELLGDQVSLKDGENDHFFPSREEAEAAALAYVKERSAARIEGAERRAEMYPNDKWAARDLDETREKNTGEPVVYDYYDCPRNW